MKIVLGSAAAAGLSHFRFLNVGGAAPVSAGDQCGLLQSADGWCMSDPDICSPSDPADWDGRDTCWPDETYPDPDVCTTADVDVCVPPGDTDECAVAGDPDTECGAQEDPDQCWPEHHPDLCWPDHDPDDCAPPADEDICSQDSPDVCDAAGDPDYKCEEEDVCSAEDPDLCAPVEDGGEPDECLEVVGDPDYGDCYRSALDVCTPPSDPDLCNPMLDPDDPARQPPPPPPPPPPSREFVPEPGSMGLLASGLLGLAGYAALRWRGKDEEQE